MNEKRKHVRTAFSAYVKFMHASVGELKLKMRDMSDGGVFLFSTDLADLPLGEAVQIQALDIEDAPLLNAIIVRRETVGIGLRFVEE
jgi:c-di-GMP-binding flagellar brake protein YcgR